MCVGCNSFKSVGRSKLHCKISQRRPQRKIRGFISRVGSHSMVKFWNHWLLIVVHYSLANMINSALHWYLLLNNNIRVIYCLGNFFNLSVLSTQCVLQETFWSNFTVSYLSLEFLGTMLWNFTGTYAKKTSLIKYTKFIIFNL